MPVISVTMPATSTAAPVASTNRCRLSVVERLKMYIVPPLDVS